MKEKSEGSSQKSEGRSKEMEGRRRDAGCDGREDVLRPGFRRPWRAGAATAADRAMRGLRGVAARHASSATELWRAIRS
jgi:hypothetical protein